MRQIEPFFENLSFKGAAAKTQSLQPNPITDPIPEMLMVDPGALYVDENYQRDLSRSSITLIRKIIHNFSWRKFKPPIVARTEIVEHGEPKTVYMVIDGQHTAIAAATHPDVKYIPVLCVAAETTASQADGFIGHNRDRLNVTPTQLFFSALAAEDADARTVKHVCDQAGVVILKNPPAAGKSEPGTTIALGAIQSLVRRRYTLGARRVLSILVEAECTPIMAGQIKAVEALLHDHQFEKVADKMLTEAIRRLGEGANREAALFAAAHKIQQWKALAIVYYRAIRSRKAA